MEKIKRILCVAVVMTGTISACQAGDSLEAKLAKLETAAKTKQSAPESSAESQTTEATAPQDPIKVTSAAAPAFPEAEEDWIAFEVTADYMGKYIWRGQNISDDPAFQPSVSVSAGGFTAAWWGSMDTSKINGNNGQFIEHDYSLDYSGDVPLIDGVGYSVGVINYYFPSGEDTTEVYWGFGFDLPLSPSVAVYHDVDDVKGTYISTGVSHSVERIGELDADTPIAMDFSASLGWGSASYNKAYWGPTINTGKMNDVTLSVSFPFEIAGWSLSPSLNYVNLVNGKVRETNVYNSQSDYFFGGISAAKGF